MKTLVLILLVGLISSACSGIEVTKAQRKIKAPYDGTRFNNIEPFDDKSFLTVMRWKLANEGSDWEMVQDQKFYKPKYQRSEKLKMTMIGHTTVLIQIDNVNILTDPHYSDRASPFSWIGPQRVIQPAIKFEDLPPIDLVLISHDHYDHLDYPTIKMLDEKFAPTVLVGLGNKRRLEDIGIQNVYEMDWWDEFIFKNINLHFTPVQHWSARGLFDKRQTLWGGFYIQANQKIFFMGDTGYGKVFKMIKEKYGPMDVGLIPIGAYEPRWFMKDAHINPEESVKVFLDLGLKQAMGVHFGTFEGLTDEPKEQPIADLERALKKYEVLPSDFIAPEFGVTYEY